MSFRGEYHNIVDEKGRLSIPVKFRDGLMAGGELPVLTRGFDQCLWLLTAEDWKKNEEQFSQMNPFDADSRKVVRVIAASSVDCELDKQGRIAIPSALREAAGLKRDVVVAGIMNHIEIWDRETFERDRADGIASIGTLTQRQADKGNAPRLFL